MRFLVRTAMLLVPIAVGVSTSSPARAWEPPDLLVVVDGGLEPDARDRALLAAKLILAARGERSVVLTHPSEAGGFFYEIGGMTPERRNPAMASTWLAPGDGVDEAIAELSAALDRVPRSYLADLSIHLHEQMGMGPLRPRAPARLFRSRIARTVLVVIADASSRQAWSEWAHAFRGAQSIDPTDDASGDDAATTAIDAALAACRTIAQLEAYECRPVRGPFTLPISQRAMVIRERLPSFVERSVSPWDAVLVDATDAPVDIEGGGVAVAMLTPYVHRVSLEHLPVIEIEAAVVDVWPYLDRGYYSLRVQVDGEPVELEQETANRGRIPASGWRPGSRMVVARLSGGHLLHDNLTESRRVLVSGHYDAGAVVAGEPPSCVAADASHGELPQLGLFGATVEAEAESLCVRAPFFSVLTPGRLNTRWTGDDLAPRTVVAELRPNAALFPVLAALLVLAFVASFLGGSSRHRPRHVAWPRTGTTYREGAGGRYETRDVASAASGASIGELSGTPLAIEQTARDVLVEAKGNEPLLVRIGSSRIVRTWRVSVGLGDVVALGDRQLVFVGDAEKSDLLEGRLSPALLRDEERQFGATLPVVDLEPNRRRTRLLGAVAACVTVAGAAIGIAALAAVGRPVLAETPWAIGVAALAAGALGLGLRRLL